jgi:hypothetical protein
MSIGFKSENEQNKLLVRMQKSCATKFNRSIALSKIQSGNGNFVEKVLSQASEQMERWYRLKAEGWMLKKITERVAEIFGIKKDQVVVTGKQPDRIRGRSVLTNWAIRDLGLTATEVGKYLGLSKSAVSRAATRGQKLIVDQFLSLKGWKRVISTPLFTVTKRNYRISKNPR